MICFIKKFFKIDCNKNLNNGYCDKELLKSVLNEVKVQNERLNEIMSALTNLQDAISRLSHATDKAVTVLNTPHPTEEALQAAADLVNAQAARLEAASDSDPTTVAE